MTAMHKLSGISIISMRRLGSVAVAVLALPVVMGPGKCGFVLDFTETALISDKIDKIVLGVDDGTVDATMYDREATLLKRHTFAFEPSIGELTSLQGATEDGTLTLEARCKYEGNCSFDHLFELPLGISLEISMVTALIRIGYISGDVDITFATGSFKGVRLAAPNFTLTAETAEITADYATAPQTVTIAIDDGEVTLEVPAGEYRCALTAGGKVTNTGITCNDAAAAVLDVQVGAGDITVTGT